MIKRLRNRFIRIAAISVAAVMLLLTVVLNTVNFISTDSDLRNTLMLIYDNQGIIPISDNTQPPDKKPDKSNSEMSGIPDSRFTKETPFSTRYFVLRYTDDGELTQAELDRIASVSEDDVSEYLDVAIKNGSGYGYYGSYRFFTARTGENKNIAIFLDCYQEIRSAKLLIIWSLAADAGCILLVFLMIVLLSRKAIDPIVCSIRQQKQFITDASHELKTPVTVISTSLKVLEMETGPQKWIDKARTQTEKLTELINSMVTLSRMDEEDSPLNMENFCVSDAVEETAESFRDFALSSGHELNTDIAPNISFCGDEYSIRQLTSIFLDNAVKYAVPDSPISVTLEKSRRNVVIRVSNRCLNPDSIDTSRLFDRFYRADPARTGISGFGIGLSIARSIAEGHHGSVSASISGDLIEFTACLKQ
jgi:two-component system, OmpR family, sensor histidine kinase CiaH